MVRGNTFVTRLKPINDEVLQLEVVRRRQCSPHIVRVTLGRGDIDQFVPLGFDQWFRLFLPAAEGAVSRIPAKLDFASYVKLLALSKAVRPIMRDYTVRAFRARGVSGAELDVDFVLHGITPVEPDGFAARWAMECMPGEIVAIRDEGVAFNPAERFREHVLIVADESGMPGAAGILNSLPSQTSGTAIIEVPDVCDAQYCQKPAGVDVRWIPRERSSGVPGRAALAAARALALPAAPFYGWVAGERSLATSMRRYWVDSGVPKEAISFCGYWRSARPR